MRAIFFLLGCLVDNFYISVAYTGLYAVETRSNPDFRYYQMGSPFESELVRLLYTKVRKVEIAK